MVSRARVGLGELVFEAERAVSRRLDFLPWAASKRTVRGRGEAAIATARPHRHT